MTAVTVEDKGAISIIRINRPERLNAIDRNVAVELQQAFKTFDADATKRVAILSSTGDRAFSSGADVANLPELWRSIPTIGYNTEKPMLESAPLVIGALKRLVAEVMPAGPIERMVGVAQTIAQTIAHVRQSEDFKEGIAAYKEKRKPVFKGR